MAGAGVPKPGCRAGGRHRRTGDYLPCEFEYLYFLSRHEHAAARTGDAAALVQIRAAARRFLDEHLLRWLPRFLATARRASPGPFHAAALDSLERLVSEERARQASG